MKIRTAILVWLVVLVPLVARADPVTGDPTHVFVLELLLPVAAEVMVEVRILRLQEIWLSTWVLLLLLHCVTVPLLLYFVASPGAEISIFVGEAAVVAIEGTSFYVGCLVSVKFRRSFLCCLRASAVGNFVSFFVAFAAQSLARHLV